MLPQRQPPLERKHAWLPARPHRAGSPIRRLAQRLFWAGLLIALLLGFMKLLSRPLQSTATGIFVVQGQDPLDPRAPDPMAYQSSDLQSLRATAPTLRRTEQEADRVTLASRLAVRDELSRLAEQISAGIDSPSDVVITYVKADGLLSDGTPHLRWQFDPQWTKETTLPVIDLLRMLSQRPCAAKLLVLDCGSVPYDLSHGTLVNQFVTQLQAQVDQVGDPSLWVMTSRADFESSHFSRSLGQSVFAHMFSQALSELADHDRDGSLTVVEAYRFTNQQTAEWIEQKSAGRLSQTPQLFHFGRINWADSPEILALNRTWQPDEDSAAAAEERPPADAEPSPPPADNSETASVLFHVLRPMIASRSVANAVAALEPARDQFDDSQQDAEASAKQVDTQTPAASEQNAAVQDEKPSDSQADSGTAAVAADDSGDVDRSDTPIASVGENPAWSVLLQAWQTRDLLAEQAVSPVTFAPLRFRLLQAMLRRRQAAVIYAAEDTSQAAAAALSDVWQGADQLPAIDAGTSQAMRELAALWPGSIAVSSAISPAGQLQLTESAGWQANAEDLAQIRQLEQLVRQPDSQPLAAWLADLPPQSFVTREQAFAERLLQDHRLDWKQVSGLLQLRLQADRAAAACALVPGKLDAALLAAERRRLGIERELVFAPERTPKKQALQLITVARRQLEDLLATAETLHQARHVLVNALWRIPDDIRDFRCQASSRIVTSVDYFRLKDHLQLLEQLLVVLIEPWSVSSDVAHVRDLMDGLRRSEELLAAARAATVQSVGGRLSTWQEFRIQILLDSPQLSSAQRGQLLSALQNISAAPSEVKAVSAQRPREVSRTRLPADIIRQHAELELLRCRLMTLGHVELDEQYARLDEQYHALGQDADASGWNQFARGLRSMHSRLAAEVRRSYSDERPAERLATGPTQRLSELSLTSALALLPVIQTSRVELPLSPSLSQLQQQTLQSAQTRLQLERVKLALQDAPSFEVDHLHAQLSDQAAASLDPLLKVELPVMVPLAVGDTVRLPVQLLNPGTKEVAVRMMTEVDEGRIRLESSPGFQTVTAQRVRRSGRMRQRERQRELQDLLRAHAVNRDSSDQPRIDELVRLLERGAYPLDADPLLSVPTVIVPAGGRRNVPLTLTCVAGTTEPTWLTLRLQTADQNYRFDVPLEIPREHSVLPRLTGTPGTVDQRRPTLLSAFPNTTTAFAFQLQSQVDFATVLQAELLAAAGPLPDLPSFAMSIEAGLAWRKNHAEPQPLAVADVSLAARQTVALPFVLPETGEASPAESSADESAGTAEPTESEAEPAVTSEPIPAVAVDHGLILSLTDKRNGTISMFHFPVAVQHPRRFLKAQARRDPLTGEVIVEVAAEDAQRLPSESVRLELGFRPAGATGVIAGTLSGQQDSVQLRATPAAGQSVVELSVNGHHRAFAWLLNEVGGDGRLLPDDQTLAVSILDPAPQAAIAAPAASISVSLDVAAPPGFPGTADDQLALGIDANRDRELADDEPLIVRNTQSIQVLWDGLTDDGDFRLGSRVAPLVVELPVARFRSNVNLLAQLRMADRTVWSSAVPLCFDGSPPRLTQLGTVPAERVAVGAPLMVVASGSDGDSSGIEQVLAGFAAADSRTMLETPAPVPLQLTDGRWVGTADTTGLTPGPAIVLLQATDRAGNRSVPLRRAIRVISAEQAARMEAEAVNDIRGTILYGGQPVAGCRISLAPPALEEPADPNAPASENQQQLPVPEPVVTDELGNFWLKDVRVGKYTLTAFAVVRGLKREKQADVTVAPPPARHRVDLDLR
ncbi:MAG: carboxypeptidase-like regulatory domain-containing protein [Planctomycetaceae bacterium]|nr:carboxypeptidase-like regulatory domain-containing protein [Planctomycetaceae bacterium]